MRFSRTNMRLAASRLPDLSREIDAQAAEFSITHFCPRNPGLTKSTTYARETAKIGRSLFKSSHGTIDYERCNDPTCREVRHDGRDLRKRLLWTAFFGFARRGMIAGLAAATAMSWSHDRSGGSCRR